MLRVLLCMTCCSAPPRTSKSRRPSSSANSTTNSNRNNNNLQLSDDEKTKKKIGTELTDFKSLITLTADEKDQLIANQRREYDERQKGNGDFESLTQRSDSKLISGRDPITASTSHLATLKDGNQKQRQLLLQEELRQKTAINAEDLSKRLARASDTAARDLSQSYADGDDGDQESISAPSSIDIEPFTENPHNSAAISEQFSCDYDDPSNHITIATRATRTTASHNYGSSSITRSQQSQSQLQQQQQNDNLIESSSSRKSLPSVTKIGDYARLEYSPVEDLESVTTMSYSRVGSEKSGRRLGGEAGGDAVSGTTSLSRRDSVKTAEGSISRRSSQGIESTSISIASQLSSEQIQQNLTNMLETANSPTPFYGTIGLPLGPPLEATYTETAKTSPETTGAALTSASQDSLSDGPLDDPTRQTQSRPLTVNSSLSNTGGALVGSIEDSIEISQTVSSGLGEDRASTTASKNSDSTTVQPSLEPSGRIGSPISMSTATSGGLTNPTPTPSEQSAGSGKKKSKARSLLKGGLKRLRSGKKKSKDGPGDKENE